MIYTELTNKAMRIAYDAHQGQTDKCGIPYIFHPFHLAEQMTDEYEVCTALLHDVVEDTCVTLAELQSEFPPEVLDALRLLTHDDTVDYFDYVRRLKQNPIARTVKLADLAHNSDRTRFTALSGSLTDDQREQIDRRCEKYEKAGRILSGESEGHR